jgi:putative salt-induced outer membrane protein
MVRFAVFCFAVTAAFFPAPKAFAADNKAPNQTWVSEVALGATLATGNTERKGADLDAKAKYRNGRIEDRYKLIAELGRDSGVTTSQRWVAAYESSVDFRDGLFALGFAQYEDDKFSGFQSEIEAGLGVGYRVLQTSAMLLSVNVGPGYRIGKLQAPLADEKEIFARGTALFEWTMSDNAKLSNDLSLRWDAERTKIENTLAITSKLIGSLAARASFNVRHTSSPPRATLKKTDTVTKLALVYSF